VAEGIKKVVIGTRDPFEKVNGKGIERLEAAGLQVVCGVLEAECRWQNRRFFTFHQKQRPYVHLKWAQTSNGFMSAGEENRLKITGPMADRLVHKMRSEEAAILVGTQTAMLDNPLLTNRLWSGVQPIRVVIDRNLALPASAKLLTDGRKTLVLNSVQEGMKGNVLYKKVEGLEKRDPSLILKALFEEGIQSVLVEGGPTLHKSFLIAGLWDEAHIFTNTKLVAGEGLKAPSVSIGRLKASILLRNDKMEWMVNS
jgi:diaminohydroxyphosphoribosylaminopyrimidine deaminase/5-amino-6-(5-phosphoribosylamino)uracil reductase